MTLLMPSCAQGSGHLPLSTLWKKKKQYLPFVFCQLAPPKCAGKILSSVPLVLIIGTELYSKSKAGLPLESCSPGGNQ